MTEKLLKMVRDGETSTAVTAAIEQLESVLHEIDEVHGSEMLDELGFELLRVKGEAHAISLCRAVGSHIVNVRCSTWKAKDGAG